MAEQVSDADPLGTVRAAARRRRLSRGSIQRHRLRLHGTVPSGVLRSDHDIEDVLQATDLVLAQGVPDRLA